MLISVAVCEQERRSVIMEKRRLGNTDIEVSRMCFGTLTLGPLQADLSIDEGAEVIIEAFSRGINFVDTAQLYKTYRHIRRAMDVSGQHDIVISSKAYAVTREDALRAVEEARKELDRDIIDIFMLHDQESIHTIRGHAEALDCLFELKAKGIIKAVGLSTHWVDGVRGAIEAKLDIVHPLINKSGIGIVGGGVSDMLEAISEAHDNGIGTFAMKPLGGGNLIRDPEGAFEFVQGQNCLDSIAVGMRTQAEVEANVRIFEGHTVDEDLREQLNKVPRELMINFRCTGCGSCLEMCGNGAISVVDGKAQVDRQLCVICGYCATKCPSFAIRVI